MLHPATRLEWISDEIGYGVVATEPIPRGTITWVRDRFDIELKHRALAAVSPADDELLERFSYRTGRGTRLLCWDFTRFMNHSCEATSFLVGSELEIAIRDVAPGEQLTSDYGSLNLEHAFECLCLAATCRGHVRPEDFERHAPAWDAEIRAALPLVATVEQRLAPCATTSQRLARWSAEPHRAPSILANRWTGDVVVLPRALAAASPPRAK